MIAVVTVLCAFPLGYFLRSRLAATTTYAVAYLWAFVFQTLYLLLDSLGDSTNPAFESAPSCCSRNRSGICWRSAISRAGTNSPPSRRSESSIMALIAYSSFWETFSTGHPFRQPG